MRPHIRLWPPAIEQILLLARTVPSVEESILGGGETVHSQVQRHLFDL